MERKTKRKQPRSLKCHGTRKRDTESHQRCPPKSRKMCSARFSAEKSQEESNPEAESATAQEREAQKGTREAQKGRNALDYKDGEQTRARRAASLEERKLRNAEKVLTEPRR